MYRESDSAVFGATVSSAWTFPNVSGLARVRSDDRKCHESDSAVFGATVPVAMTERSEGMAWNVYVRTRV